MDTSSFEHPHVNIEPSQKIPVLIRKKTYILLNGKKLMTSSTYSRKKYHIHDDLYYVLFIHALSTRNLITVAILHSEKLKLNCPRVIKNTLPDVK